MDGRSGGVEGGGGLTADSDHVTQVTALSAPRVYGCSRAKGYHRSFHLTHPHSQMSVFWIICSFFFVFFLSLCSSAVFFFFLFFSVMIWSQIQPCFNVCLGLDRLGPCLIFTGDQVTLTPPTPVKCPFVTGVEPVWCWLWWSVFSFTSRDSAVP